MRFAEISIRQPKSSIKAGEGLECGTYKFFTSGVSQSKFLNEASYHGPALIFGTGGSPSVHYCEEDFSTSTDCLVYYPSDESVDFYCAYLFFKSHMYLLEKGFRGAGLKHIKKDYIENIEINWPNEDRRNVINTTSKKIDILVAKRKEQLDKLDVLSSALFYEMFGDLIQNSKGWRTDCLNVLGYLGRGVSKHRPRNAPELLGGTMPLIQTGDVANADFQIRSYSSTYSELGVAQSKVWPKGTLCITIAANIGKCAILNFDACFPDSVVGFTANDSVNTSYIYFVFKDLQRILESKAPGAAQKNINLEILRKLQIPVPPLSLQQEFAEKFADIEKQKKLIRNSLKKLELLKNSLLQQYFA